jgi:hypothetical protein
MRMLDSPIPSESLSISESSRRLTRRDEAKRVQIVLNAKSAARLDELCGKAGDVSISETIRNALLVYDEMVNSVIRGDKVIVEDRGGAKRELRFMIDAQRREEWK